MHQFSDFLNPNLPNNGFWGQNFKNPGLDSESASLTYYEHQFSDKTDNFEFLGPNLPKNEFWGRNFKNLSLDSESTPPKIIKTDRKTSNVLNIFFSTIISNLNISEHAVSDCISNDINDRVLRSIVKYKDYPSIKAIEKISPGN